MRKILSGFTIAVLCFAVFIPVSLRAQSIWLDRSHDRSVGLEIFKPNFKNINDATITTSNSGWVFFPSLRWPLSTKVHFVGELPFAFASAEVKSSRFNINQSRSESVVGNPYLGVEIKGRNSPVFTEIGIRLPISSEKKFLATGTGILADIDRLEAFFPNTLSITGMLNYHHREVSGFALRFRGGPSLLINTDSGSGDDTELFIGYSAQAGYESERFSLLGGLTGRANLTEEDADFSERSVHQLGFNASLGLGKVRPGLHFRLPLDEDLKDSLDFVLGFNLGIQL